MVKVDCPQCGSRSASVSLMNGYKYYCPQCGWNNDIARSALTSDRKVGITIAIVGLILAVFVCLRDPGEWVALVGILVVFCAVPLAYALSAIHQLHILKPTMLCSAGKRNGFYPDFRPASLPAASATVPLLRKTALSGKEYRDLAVLARPRKLKMTWRGRLYSGLVSGAVILYSYFRFPATWDLFWRLHSRGVIAWELLFGWPLLIYGCAFVFFRNRLRERWLLANGDVASGYVVSERNRSFTHSVRYSFKDASGQTIEASCTDPSRSLYEGMTVSVFYNARNPKISKPLACSLTTVDTE